jgi:hypothetical protein
MCQEAVRRLCSPSESGYVRKVARLLAQPLKQIVSVSQPYPLLVIPVRAVNNRIGYNWENRVSGLPKALIWPVISTRA